jgi:hypothetical protein
VSAVSRSKRILSAARRAALLALLALAAAAATRALAQETGWQTFSRPELGLTLQRPADLYELDPESPAEDVVGEVEFGPKDASWSILVTSQKLQAGQTLDSILAEEKQRNPRAEIGDARIGDGIEVKRVWALDDDSLSTFVLLLDKAGTRMIAIELAITLAEEDAGKGIDALRGTYGGVIALYERILATVRIARN